VVMSEALGSFGSMTSITAASNGVRSVSRASSALRATVALAP
jgi:hypothetical protein